MSFIEQIARLESKFRPMVSVLPPYWVSMLYSTARRRFLSLLYEEEPSKPFTPPKDHHQVLWDICFGSKLFNSAGMFKNGHGYNLTAMQGAAAYLAGTTTARPRKGNKKYGIKHPFMPYPSSGAASNWMGLPNEGHAVVAKRLSRIPRRKLCPIGASLSLDPDLEGMEALGGLVEGFKLYQIAAVEFIELNESCPNVPHEKHLDESTGLDTHLLDRLEYISENVLKKREARLPVIVKLSLDTDKKLLRPLIEALVNFGFDGINLGNTSIKYKDHSLVFEEQDCSNYDYFTTKFGGGVSGRPLKAISLELAREAVSIVREIAPSHEFHVIRTGGIDEPFDLKASDDAGIALNQWFTGYFETFARHGHDVYRHMLNCRCI